MKRRLQSAINYSHSCSSSF